MTKNSALAWEVYDLIDKNRAHLDMGNWVGGTDVRRAVLERRASTVAVTLDDLTADSCGTTACFAGWAVAASGRTLSLVGDLHNAAVIPDINIAEAARTLLGIGYDESHALFYETENEELEEAVTELFGPRPEVAP